MSFASRGPVSPKGFHSQQHLVDKDIRPACSKEPKNGSRSKLLYGTIALASVACAALIVGSVTIALGAAIACAAAVTIAMD